MPLISEKDFQQTVVEYAHALGYLVYHQIDMGRKDPETGSVTFSRRIGPGFPDLILARHGFVLAVELKSEKGRITPNQNRWLELFRSAGIPALVWRPSQWDTIERVLNDEKTPSPLPALC